MMDTIQFIFPGLLAASMAQPAHAEGPLAELLAAAPAFTATFLNLAANDAQLDGGISINLAAPVIASDTGFASASPAWVSGPTQQERHLPVSTIGNMTTSGTGVLQTGTISITATHLWNDSPALAGAPPTGGPSTAPTPQVSEYTLVNQGTNLGDVQTGMAVSTQNQTVELSDQSASAIGGMNTGQIRILISEE